MQFDHFDHSNEKKHFNIIKASMRGLAFLIILLVAYMVVEYINLEQRIIRSLIICLISAVLLLMYVALVKGKHQYRAMIEKIELYSQLQYGWSQWITLGNELSSFALLYTASDGCALTLNKKEEIIKKYIYIKDVLCIIKELTPEVNLGEKYKLKSVLLWKPCCEKATNFFSDFFDLNEYLQNTIQDRRDKKIDKFYRQYQEVMNEIVAFAAKLKTEIVVLEIKELSISAKIYYKLHKLGRSPKLAINARNEILVNMKRMYGVQLDIANELNELQNSSKKTQEQAEKIAQTLQNIFVSHEDGVSVQKKILEVIEQGKKVDVKALFADKSADVVVSGVLAALPYLIPKITL